VENVYNFIKKIDIKSEYIVAAVSGGPDSMLMLNILMNYTDKMIVVAHVHHNLREESDYEAFKLEEFCKKNNLIFEMMKIEKYPNNKFSEEAAREIRYNFFDKVVKKYNADILFTAHHADDLIETILMRITRGSSIRGYAGFNSVSHDRGYKIAKPLIYLTKDDILNEINKLNIWYAIDKTNKTNKYKRNRFRNKILPVLKLENPVVHKKFLEFSDKIFLVDEYIKKQVDLVKDKVFVNDGIDVLKFNTLDDILKIYIIEKYLNDIYGDNISYVTSINTNIIMNTMKKVNAKISLPLNKIGLLEYNTFKIIDKLEDINYDIVFNDKVKLHNGKTIEIDNTTKETTNFVIHLNSSEIKFPLHVRCKRNGDFMYVKNMNGKKSISNIFTDAKISKEYRSTYPIVTDDNNEILWIPGLKKSKFDRKKDGKYDIILRYH